MITPDSTESLTSQESSAFASVSAPSKFSPSPSSESAPALETRSGSFEAGTAHAQFALASVPETSVEDTYTPFLESFSALEPATDRFVDAEVVTQGSKPSMDRSEESTQYGTEESSPRRNTSDRDSTDGEHSVTSFLTSLVDTDPEYLIDEAEDSSTPTRRSRRESRKREGTASNNNTSVVRSPDVIISSTADGNT